MKLFLALVLAIFASAAFADKPDIVEVVSVEGVIDDGMAQNITEQVEKINENKRVRAVLLVVDSPGGGVLPSAVIYEELSKLKVPVVAWCNNVCASGGMYVSMAPTVKYIGVRTSTISGSIGVVMHMTRYNRLLEWAKIDNTTYKSGGLKDAGNGDRAVEEGEVAYLQSIVDNMAARFYAVVTKSRTKLSDAQLVDIKTARIFIGSDGVKSGLVDAVMTRDEAIKRAKELSGSSQIFTRDEMKKLTKDSDASTYGSEAPAAPTLTSRIIGLLDNLHVVADAIREIRSGASMRVEYRMPFTF